MSKTRKKKEKTRLTTNGFEIFEAVTVTNDAGNHISGVKRTINPSVSCSRPNGLPENKPTEGKALWQRQKQD